MTITEQEQKKLYGIEDSIEEPSKEELTKKYLKKFINQAERSIESDDDQFELEHTLSCIATYGRAFEQHEDGDLSDIVTSIDRMAQQDENVREAIQSLRKKGDFAAREVFATISV